jgi:copper chaperone for superoxide dismutase
MVQVARNLTLVDLTIRGVSQGTYHISVRERGDISSGAESTGPIWGCSASPAASTTNSKPARGTWGTVQVGQGGIGAVFLDKPIEIWEMIGRSIVVSRQQDGPFNQSDPDTLVGVIARSAGVWDNDKTVCSCSGKTVWEERKEQVDRGML